jgi:hypothetical protein
VGFLELARELIADIDFTQTEIIRPKTLLFLCGGKESQATRLLPSMRETLLRRLPDRRVFGRSQILLAERAIEALPDTTFENLLDLEECIAAVVDAIVLIVESPGSICELGAFAKTPEISRKLLVVIQNDFANAQSFITLGALGYLKSRDPSREIMPYHWTDVAAEGVLVSDYILNAMIADITEALGKVPRSEKFHSEERGHMIYLTLAFCHLLRGAKLGELKQCFEFSSITIAENEIKKGLETLQICGLLKKVNIGPKRVHYVARIPRIPLEIAFRTGVADRSRDTLRRLTLIVEAIAREDKDRISIFRDHNDAS